MNEVNASRCTSCGGLIECSWRSKLSKEYYCVTCGKTFGYQPIVKVDSTNVDEMFHKIYQELISHGIVKPNPKIVSRIVMKQMNLCKMTTSYIVTSDGKLKQIRST